MLRLRPIRSRIYQPIFRYGILATDIYAVVGCGIVFWAVPMIFKMTIWGIPAFLFTGPGMMLIAYTFLRWIRVGKPGGWFTHNLRALVESPIERGALPGDISKQPRHSWLKR